MKLHRATSRLSVFILLGAAWSFVSPDVASAQTNQDDFVTRDPVSGWYEKGSVSESAKYGTSSEPEAVSRNYRPARLGSRVLTRQEQEPSPQEKLDRDVDLPQLQDESQDQLDKEIREAMELDEPDLTRKRQAKMDFSKWPNRTMGEIRVSLKDANDVVPEDLSYLLTDRGGPTWASASYGTKVFAWAAPNIRYQPLYFQNVPIERYGRDCGPVKQIAASGVHFFASTVVLPYAMLVDRPRSCDYPLGYCRPGNTVPLTFQKAVPRFRK